MELYVKTLINGAYVEKKCSLFGDEEIEITKTWNEQQILTGYGSYSKTFSIPIDSNNSEIFKYYELYSTNLVLGTDITLATQLNPNYFIPARIVINDFELVGNLQIINFSTKNMEPYSYSITFYGNEKNLIKTRLCEPRTE